MKNKKGFTLIELLTVIAILAVILLIAAPVILGVLDKARKNTFKNQVLLYVEGLKQQTALAAMGAGYSELQKVDTRFYSPTSDSTGKLVRVNVSNLNKVMDNAILSSDTDRYFYVEYTTNGYNYYIGEGVKVTDGYQTTCAYATGDEACVTKTYNEESVKLINSRIFNTIHVTRNDVATSASVPDTTIPNISATLAGGLNITLTMSDNVGIASYCISETNSSDGCTWTENTISHKTITMSNAGTYYAFVKDTSDNISNSVEFRLRQGEAISLGNYNWHIIGEDATKMWLLMDAGQLSNMNHCNTGSSSNCTWNNEYYVYSWENSLIRADLNSTFYNTLIANDSFIASKIVETEVCKDTSIYSSDTWSYGGYIMSEIQALSQQGASCTNGYTSDKVRLISPSEYYNLTDFYSTTSYPVSAPGGNGKGYISEVSYMTRLSSNNWLYSSTINAWWTMGVFSNSSGSHVVKSARHIWTDGELSGSFSEYTHVVRPVIVLQK